MVFPSLATKRIGYLNLNDLAEQILKSDVENFPRPKRSLLLNCDICTAAVLAYHAEHHIDYSYGGWLENRSTVWRGSYLEEENTFIHLGMDFNVAAGTPIAVEHEAEVLRIDDDSPEEHGWGNRVIVALKQEPIVLIYAHLDYNIRCAVGDVLMSGQVFADVGKPEQNGGWYPHLHVQAVDRSYFNRLLKDDLRDLDGYGSAESIEALALHYPDPINYLCFR